MSCYDLIVGYYVGAASENLIGVGVVSEKYTEVGTVSDYIDIMSDNIDIITDTNDTRTLKTMTTNDKKYTYQGFRLYPNPNKNDQFGDMMM